MDEQPNKLKEIILRRYPSIRVFAREAEIPHGTLVSALNPGIDGMAEGKLEHICRFSDIDAIYLEPISRRETAVSEMEKRLLAYYNRLNDWGRVKVEEYVKDISRIAAYEEKAASHKAKSAISKREQ